MSRKPRGIGLVGAISLIVVTALLALAITRTVFVRAQATSLDVLDHKANLAAGAGAQISLNRVYAPEGVGACANVDYTLNELVGLNMCSVSTTCANETVRGRTYVTISSTGRCTAAGLTTSRAVLVRARL